MFSNTKTSSLVVFLLITLFTLHLQGQTPTTCFEIESILVDACGNNEGENEMVRFKVGPNNLNTNNLNVNWPNNSYLNICKNATTASKVASLNSSIVGCGFLKEPTGNILPAGSSVILLTSTNFNVTANSFSNLNDTMYVIFQCSGNTAGHFANYNSTSSTRTLTMSFSSPSGCFDMVSYDRSLLVDAMGIPSNSDGSRVDYDWGGSATYANDGCSAPIINNSIDITSSNISICPGDTIPLTSTISGSLTNLQWVGNNGSFSSTSNANTNYFSSVTDNSNFYIYLSATTTCGVVIKDSVLVQMGGNTSSVTITSASTELCNGDSILLTANGSGNYTWSTGSNANFIYVSSAGNYTVTSTSSCGSSNDNVTITNAPTINLSLTTPQNQICSGTSATLTASGAPNYTWFNNTTGTNETVNTSGNYYVIGYNNCYRDSQSVSITVIPNPTVSISSSSASSEICIGDTITLTANGSGGFLWNTSDTSSVIKITNAGTYTVTSTNSCGNSSDNITLTDAPIINLTLTTPNTSICLGNAAVLTANGASNYTWFNNATSTTQTVNSSGTYYVIGYNNCYRDSQSVSITVLTPPSISISSSNTNLEICTGQTINLTANGSNNYLWNTSDTSSTITVNFAGTYSVSSTNPCGTDTKQIIITSGAIPSITITGDSILCNSQTINLTANGTGNLLWSNGSQNQSTSFNSGGQVFVIASNNCGADTAYHTIVNYSLNASFTSDYVYGSDIPVIVNFTNTSSNSTNYEWNFGDGGISFIENPTHTYTTNGEFTIVLTASNQYCTDNFEATINFDTPNGVFIPNVFTPNNDDVNDVFEIIGENIAKIECHIFNRWGEKLYSWDNLAGFWDGKYNSTLVSDGTYFYVANITWKDDSKETLRGHISVLK